MRRGRINTSFPVNWDSPLNDGLYFWLALLPNNHGEKTFWDLTNNFLPAPQSSPVAAAASPNEFPAIDTTAGSFRFGYGAITSNVGSVSGVAITSTLTGYNCLFSARSGDSDGFEVFVYAEPGSGSLGWGNYNNQAKYVSGITSGQWFHWALTSDGTNTKVYVNGVKGGVDGTTNWTGYATQWIDVGSRSGSFGFPGSIAYVRYHTKALSDAGVMAEYEDYLSGWDDSLQRRSQRLGKVPPVATFNPAWAMGSNRVLTPTVF